MEKIYLNLEPFQETLYADMCGPASLKIVLNYYGIDKTEKELAQLMGVVSGIGVCDRNIVDTAKMFGLNAQIENECEFKDIEKWLQKEVPVIVDWFSKGRKDYGDSEVADGHYSVVCGLDDEFIYLQDPEIGGERKFKKEDFMKVWFDFEGTYIKSEELIIRQLIAVFK